MACYLIDSGIHFRKPDRSILVTVQIKVHAHSDFLFSTRECNAIRDAVTGKPFLNVIHDLLVCRILSPAIHGERRHSRMCSGIIRSIHPRFALLRIRLPARILHVGGVSARIIAK